MKNQWLFLVCAFVVFALLHSACNKETVNPGVTELTGEINTDSTLRHTKNSTVDYRVSGTLFVNAKLRIQPGTIIHLKEGATIIINNGGTLIASGTAPERITLTSTSGATWNAIVFYSESDSNRLHYCDIKNGGRGSITNPDTMVVVGQVSFAEGKVSIRDCVFESSVGNGLFINDRSSVTNFANNSFNSNFRFPIMLTTENISDLNNTASFNANGKNYVEIRNCVFPTGENQIIQKLAVPYYIDGTANLRGKDTIQASVSFVFGSNGLLISDDFSSKPASLSVMGTSANQVIFKAERGSSWQGIIARNTGGINMRYAEVKNAGNKANINGQQAGVVIENSGSNVSIRDCVFDSPGGFGIDLGGCNNSIMI